jgi:amino acid permease
MAAGHILTVFLGPGILSMPYIMSRLGWVASLTALLLFFCVTLWTSSMLAEVYEVCVSLSGCVSMRCVDTQQGRGKGRALASHDV